MSADSPAAGGAAASLHLSDVRGPRSHLRGRRPVSGRGLRLSVALPHPGHAAVPALQRGALHRQGSSEVRTQSGCFTKVHLL